PSGPREGERRRDRRRCRKRRGSLPRRSTGIWTLSASSRLPIFVSRSRTLFQASCFVVGLAPGLGFVFALLAGFRALAAVLARSALHSAQRAAIRSLRALRPAAERCDFLPGFWALTRRPL